MRLLTHSRDDRDRAAVLDEEREIVVDAADLLGEEAVTVRQLLADDRLGELLDRPEHEVANAPQPARALRRAEVELRPPIPDPVKIVCIGLNYRSHAEEAGIDPHEAPTIFGKYRNALVADGATVPQPEASEKVDYEAEIVLVIGRRATRVAPDAALDFVA